MAMKKKKRTEKKVSSNQRAAKAPAISTPIHDRQIFNLTQNAIAVFKPEDGTICDVNDIFCQGSGYSREEVIGKTSRELNLFSDEVRQKSLECLAQDGCFRNMEVEHRLKDGSTVYCIDSGDLVKIGDEHYVIVVAQDVTALKQVEKALRSERDLNRAIIDNLPGLFYIFDEDFRLQIWNDNYARTTGYSSDELRRISALDVSPPEKRVQYKKNAKLAFVSEERSNEGEILCKDGTIKTFVFNSKKINYNGRACLMGTAIDITEKKRVAEELKRSAEKLEEANITLRVLMKHSKQEQKNFENKMHAYVNDLVTPYLDKLKKSNLDERNKKYLQELESNLNGVLSPFLNNFQSLYKKLTPQEVQIVDLVGKGKSTKEIADLLNVAVNTVATHRNNIRKKLNLRNAKVNLRSHLLSFR